MVKGRMQQSERRNNGRCFVVVQSDSFVQLHGFATYLVKKGQETYLIVIVNNSDDETDLETFSLT